MLSLDSSLWGLIAARCEFDKISEKLIWNKMVIELSHADPENKTLSLFLKIKPRGNFAKLIASKVEVNCFALVSVHVPVNALYAKSMVIIWGKVARMYIRRQR